MREVDVLFEVAGWIARFAKWVSLAAVVGFVAGLACGYTVMP